jgi:antitoxin component of RelBE/YafQ-DinJ toxin-antitoxin module
MALSRLRPRSFKCDDPTWDAATQTADALGENLSEELRKFLRRYARRRPSTPTGPDQPERQHP